MRIAMRIRTIKPVFFLHEDLAKLSPLTRLFFIGLWCAADCAGRLEDRPLRLKHEIIPYDKKSAEQCLAELARGGFIVRYEVNGRRLVEIPGFIRHQVIRGKEGLAASKFPGPNDAGHRGDTAEVSPGNVDGVRNEEGNEELCVFGNTTRDTRPASECLPELGERWPNHDVPACLRRAEAKLRKEHGGDAVVAVWWFAEHWMPKEAQRKATAHGAPVAGEPEGWREWVAETYPDSVPVRDGTIKTMPFADLLVDVQRQAIAALNGVEARA